MFIPLPGKLHKLVNIQIFYNVEMRYRAKKFGTRPFRDEPLALLLHTK